MLQGNALYLHEKIILHMLLFGLAHQVAVQTDSSNVFGACNLFATDWVALDRRLQILTFSAGWTMTEESLLDRLKYLDTSKGCAA